MRYSDCKNKKNNKTVRKGYEMKSKLYCIYRDALGIKQGGPMGLTTQIFRKHKIRFPKKR